MKVLKKRAWSMEVSCDMCGSTLLVEENDVIGVYADGSYCESGELHPGFKCPACKDLNTLEWGDVPDVVIEKIRKE